MLLSPVRMINLLLLLLLVKGVVCAQHTTVYEWVGESGKWSDLQNWSVDGMRPTSLPAKDHAVFIKTETPLQITVDENFAVQTLSTEGKVEFIGKKGIEPQVASSLFLSEVTLIKNFFFDLQGTGINNFYRLTKIQSNGVKGKLSAYQDLFSISSKSGSCPFFTIVANPTAPTCNGFNNGIASILPPTDGVGPFTYQWVGGPMTRQWSNVGAGTYTIIVIDLGQGGLPCNIDVFVNEPGPLTVFSMNASPPLCAGVCDGTAAPIVIGGNGGYTLTWSSGETGPNATMLCPVFNLEIEDQLGCVYDTTYVFPNPPQPIAFDAVLGEVDCFGNDNGSIDLTIIGGIAPFDLTWSGPNGFTSTTEDISNLEPGSYTVSVEDANACLGDSTFVITENPLLQLSASTVDNLCFGGTSGSIDLTVTGGLPPFDYAWAGPNGFVENTQDLSSLEAGLYEVTVTDAANCTATLQVNVLEAPEISVSFTSVNVLCAGDQDGSANATASGGSPAYLYNWTGPNGFVSSGPGISNLFAGTYIVEVIDINACSTIDSVIVTQPDSLQISLANTEITCAGGSDGGVDLTIVGGTAPYIISWSGPSGFTSSSEDISSLSPGTYSVLVEDANGCTVAGSAVLNNPAGIALSAVTVSPACAGGSTGSINLTVSGGAAPFTFAWTGPGSFSASTEDISGIAAGTYNILATDANGCSASASYTVNPTSAPTVNFTRTNVTCFGGNNGAISIAVSGGTAPYTFLWLGPSGFFSTSQNITNLLAGAYSLQIIDANGCAGFFNTSLTQPPQITITGPITHANCFGAATGSIDAIVAGGTPGYTYSWTGPNGFTAVTQDISGLVAGVYTLTVTDAIGCTRNRNYTVNQPAQITITGNVTDIVCSDDSDGEVNVTVTAGVSPLNYAWTGPNGFVATTQDITGLIGGTYNLTITDNTGCLASASFTVNSSVLITGTASVTGISCFGLNDGAIDLTLSGGLEPYVITWAGPLGFSANTADISALEPGAYTVMAEDANGCSFSSAYTVNSPAELMLSLNDEDVLCADEANGTITSLPSGGTTPYSFNWTGPNGFTSNAQNLSNLEPGVYELTLTDASGCAVSASAEILNPLPLQITVDIVEPGCVLNDGSLTANVSGGTVATDYTYSWINQFGDEIGTTPVVNNLPPGDYTLTVTDDNGCTVQQLIELLRDSFNVSATVINISCNGSADGMIDIVPINGIPPFSYSWIGPNGFIASTSSLSGLEAGLYELLIEDNSGCQINLAYDIDEPAALNLSVLAIAESCAGADDGSINLSLTGGSPGFLVSWTGPNGFVANSFDISNLAAGLYTAQIEDSRGCLRDTIINVAAGDDFSVLLNGTPPNCPNGLDGSIDLDITVTSGAPAPFAFLWTGPNGFTSAGEDISGLSEGPYIVEVTSISGCSQSDALELTDPDAIDVIITTTNSNCLQADGQAASVATGGNPPYTFSWQNSSGVEISNNDTLFNVPAGMYMLEISDSFGCTVSETTVISDDNGSLDSNIDNPTCVGGDNGFIDITVNGTPPYTFSWSDEDGFITDTEDISDLTAGIYTVVVTDANGCIYSGLFNIIDPAPINVNSTVQDVTCNANDGFINLNISGASDPVSVSWSGPNGFTGSGEMIENLEAGLYAYTITDAQGCTLSGDVEVGVVPDPVAIADIGDVLCGGEATGFIDLTVSQGTAPYTFEWSTDNGVFSSDEDLNGLEAETYYLLVTDAAGCTFADTIQVSENTPIDFEITLVEPDCGLDNGEIHVLISGGVVSTGFFISWTDANGNVLPGDTALLNLGVGVYNLFVSDDNGCAADTSITLNNPAADITAAVNDLVCAENADGAIDLTVSDVEAPFTVSWTGPNGFSANTEDIAGLIAGAYQYLAIGNNGCQYTGSFNVLSPDSLQISVDITAACFGQSEGSIITVVSGGTAPYSFAWIGPNGFTSVAQDLIDVPAGSYTVVVTDQNACTISAGYEIIENPEIVMSATVTDLICYQSPEGAIDVEVAGGTAPFTFNWSGPNGFTAGTEDITDLESGIYNLALIDASGCGADAEYVITQPDSLQTAETFVSAGCSGSGSLGSASVFVSGGTPGFNITWSGPNGFTSTEFDIFGLEAGLYNYTVTDQNGCTMNDSIAIFDVVALEVSSVVQNISCFGLTDGAIDIEIEGGLAPYALSWSGPDGFVSELTDISQLLAGTYTLAISDSAGCTFDSSFEIVQPDEITVNATTQIDASCSTSSDGSLIIAIDGGTAPFGLNWSGPNGFASTEESIAGLVPGLYSASVVDGNGCTANADFEIGFVLEIAVLAPENDGICLNEFPALLQGSGVGTTDLIWTNLNGDTLSSTNELEISSEGIFVLFGANGLCAASDTVEITSLPLPEVDAGEDKIVFVEEVFTLGGNPTSATATAFAWTPNPLGILDTALANPTGYLINSQTFIVFATDANGCTNSDTVYVEVVPDLNVTSGFTPNNDGVNDTWVIDNMELFPNNVVHIFNRWGVAVYEQRAYNMGNAWDGTYEGEPVPVGTYYYTIELNDSRFPDPLTGPITIYR